MEKKYNWHHFFLVLFFLPICLISNINAQNLSQEGRWSNPIPFEVVPVSVANLPDGKLIVWSSKYKDNFGGFDGQTFTEIFDPFQGNEGQALGAATTVTNHDMFCPGINNLPDGRIMATGGSSSERTSIYNPITAQWERGDDMNIPRGYQGNVTLSDGSIFTIGGSWSGGIGNKDAEIWTPDGGWKVLSGLQNELLWNTNDANTEVQGVYRLDNHAWLWAAPNGKLFHAGPGETMHWIDVNGNGSVSTVGRRADDVYAMNGNSVMFDVGKILKIGGSITYSSGSPASEKSYVIDINNENNVTVVPTGNTMEHSRIFPSSTVLPNGEVLITGGMDNAEVFSDTGAHFDAEIYNPDTNTFRTVADMQVPRTYHSVAVLMTDGRVFVGGGGLCGNCNVNHPDAEIYSPPYLFNQNGSLAVRPQITAIDGAYGTGAYGEPQVAYEQTLDVTTSSNVAEFSLVRFSSATHSVNNEQRRIALTTSLGTSHRLSIPNKNIVPPGLYMLFALDTNGVPSVSETIMIGDYYKDPDMVLELKFDEGSGINVADSSIYGNDAVIVERDNNKNPIPVTQSYWSSDGLFGSAMEMDGKEFESNSIVEIPYSESMASIKKEITVMAWVYRDEIEKNVAIFAHDYPKIFFGFHNSLFKWEFPTSTGDHVSCYTGYSPPNEWLHIAATFDGTVAKLYANGIEICSDQATGELTLQSTGEFMSSFTTSGFYDRRQAQSLSGITDELDGKIDELRVFKRAMSAAEIKAFYDAKPEEEVDPTGCGLSEVANIATGSGQFKDRLYLFNWTDADFANGIHNGDSQTFQLPNGLSVTATFTNVVNGSGYRAVDMNTWQGSVLHRLYNSSGNSEALQGNTDTSYSVTFTATKDGQPYDLDLIALDAEATHAGAETISFTTNGAAWEALETYGNGGVWNGVGSSTIQVTDTEQSGGNTVHFSKSASKIDVVIDLANGNQATAFGIYLKCEDVDPCADLTILPEYTIDGTTQSGGDIITVNEGQSLVLSMLPNNIDLSITLPSGANVADNYFIQNVGVTHAGTYTLTTVDGCSKTFELVVEETGNPLCENLDIIPEYKLDGQWNSGKTLLTVTEGTSVVLSALPNGNALTITLPDGSIVGDNFSLGQVTTSDSGLYIITMGEGCTETLELIVEEIGGGSGECENVTIIPEYNIDGHWGSGESVLTLEKGTSVVLSALPNGKALTITLPNGNIVGDNYGLGEVTTSQNGIYTITMADGCTQTLEIIVEDSGGQGGTCDDTVIIPEYRLDGQWSSGEEVLSVDEGTAMVLSALPNGKALTITLPNGSVVGDNYSLGAVNTSHNGVYTITFANGCTQTLQLTVDPLTGGGNACEGVTIIPEYNLNGIWGSGDTSLSVHEGITIRLSALPNTVQYTITLPDGSVVGDNYYLGAITSSDSGIYTINTPKGCSQTFELIVTSNANPTVFPNPTTGIVNIDLTSYSGKSVRIDLLNSSNQSLEGLDVGNNHGDSVQLQLQGYADGIYYISLQSLGEETKSLPVILQK